MVRLQGRERLAHPLPGVRRLDPGRRTGVGSGELALPQPSLTPLTARQPHLPSRPLLRAKGTYGVDDGVTGILAPVNDADAWTAAVTKLATDPALAEEMGRAARKKVSEQFTAPAMARAYGEIYQGVARPPSSTRP